METITSDNLRIRLRNLNINPDIIFERYAEKHRHFHTIDHIIDMLNYVRIVHYSEINNNELFLAIVFHDIIYDSKSRTNEERSVEFMRIVVETINSIDEYKIYSNIDIELIAKLIMSTKYHQPTDILTKIIIDADLEILGATMSKLLDYEKKIFKEFQFADWDAYKTKRIKVLKKYIERDTTTKNNLTELISYIEHRKPIIGFYAGSYSPFHKGHLNILTKAEKIFDKVIVAYGSNPEKIYGNRETPEELYYRQVLYYDGLLSDYIDSLPYEVTVIRGMRNSTDFQYELNQYRFIQEMKPDVKVVSIFCDKEYEHISSSALRMLDKFNKPNKYKVK